MNNGNEVYEQIRELIGADGADKLSKSFGGLTVYIPKRSVIAARHQEIRQEFSKGVTYESLAIRYNYSESYIRKIVHTQK